LQGHGVLAQIDALLAEELLRQPVNDALIEIIAAKMRIAVRAEHFEAVVADGKNRDIERAAAEIVDRHFLVFLLIQTIGQGGGGRFIDDAQDVKTGNFSRVLCSLPLRIVEIGGNRDHRLGDLSAEIGFRGFLHFLQDHRGDFRRSIGFAHHFDLTIAGTTFGYAIGNQLLFFRDLGVFPPHKAFDREDRIGGIGDRLAFGHCPD